jgi:GTP-binding protein LepA
MPTPTPVEALGPGEVGYLIAGIKDVGEARSGETVTLASAPATEPLAGYRDPKPMVFCGLFPIDGDDFENLRESLQKLKLNDASVTYEPESSGALGFGFRCGFLGLLHMEIVKERLEREFNLALIATAPSVEYRVVKTDGETLVVDNPSELPLTNYIDLVRHSAVRLAVANAPKIALRLMLAHVIAGASRWRIELERQHAIPFE